MADRCYNCNSVLRLVRPQRGEMDAILQCEGCGHIIICDSQPSAPESLPAVLGVVYEDVAQRTPIWLN